MEQLPLPARHTIELSAFVNAGEIDPIYYEKSYYLEPEETGAKPYALPGSRCFSLVLVDPTLSHNFYNSSGIELHARGSYIAVWLTPQPRTRR